MKRIIFLVAIVTMLASCNPYGSQIPTDLVGNYVNTENFNWECGLYEEFAIYQNVILKPKRYTKNQSTAPTITATATK